MNSIIALKIYSLLKEDIIKTNAQFWREFSLGALQNYDKDTSQNEEYLTKNDINIVCCFDQDFPVLPENLKPSEKPFLFAYKGNIGLLKDESRNIAVVGLKDPAPDIVRRERAVMELLGGYGLNIVSGLALGCDTVSHECAIEHGLKTIAFLPSTIEDIYPPQNRNLATKIVKNGGLIVTEYIKNAKNIYETIARFVARDRFQAMFSKSVLLIASHRPHEGDSGSRHAMNRALEYGKSRLVMFNPQTDASNPQMALNADYFNSQTPAICKSTLSALNNV